MASVAQADQRDHLESGEAFLLQYAWRSSILHIWGLFQTVNSRPRKSHFAGASQAYAPCEWQ